LIVVFPFLRNHKWFVQSSCATSGDGLFEGLDWLETTIRTQELAKTAKTPIIIEGEAITAPMKK